MLRTFFGSCYVEKDTSSEDLSQLVGGVLISSGYVVMHLISSFVVAGLVSTVWKAFNSEDWKRKESSNQPCEKNGLVSRHKN